MAKVKKKKENKLSIKARTLELGSILARKMFQLQHNDPTIQDVIERLIILESFKYGLLNEEEKRRVLAFYGQDVEPAVVSHEYKDISPQEYAVYQPQPSFNTGLPLGNISMENQ